MEVEVFVKNNYDYKQKNTNIPLTTWQNWFKTWLEILDPEVLRDKNGELSLLLTSDPEIQDLNKQYRGKNQPTDVLAFATLEVEVPSPVDEPLYLGDLVISVDTANKQAEEFKHSLIVELAWLASHGLLHLLGEDHQDEKSLQKMLAQQATLLQAVGLII